MSSFCLLIILSALSVSHSSITTDKSIEKAICSYTDSDYNVSFNFYALKLISGEQLDYYTVEDKTENEAGEGVYSYYFNLCAPVLSAPANNCNGSTYCANINANGTCVQSADDRVPIHNLTYAYQVKPDDFCYPLSSSKTDGSNIDISLYDTDDPTQGIKIKFSDGAWADDCEANRALTINLKCEDDPASVPRTAEVTADEFAKCKYELTIDTMHGCPSGCNAYANSLCAAQGLCGYDYGSSRARCFCYYGYYGSACEKVKDNIYHILYPSTSKTMRIIACLFVYVSLYSDIVMMNSNQLNIPQNRKMEDQTM